MMVHCLLLLSSFLQRDFIGFDIVSYMVNQMPELFFFYESNESLTGRADNVELVARFNTKFFTCFRRNDDLAFRADSGRSVQFFVVIIHYVLVYKKYEMYVKYDAMLNDFYTLLQK